MAYTSQFTGEQIDQAVKEMHGNRVICDLKNLNLTEVPDNSVIVYSGGKFILGSMEDFGGGDGEPGADGIGIQSIEQTVTSEEDGGLNEVEVTLTDGTKKTLYIRNGSKGSPGKGDPGYTPVKGTDYFTPNEVNEIVNQVVAQVGTGGGGGSGGNSGGGSSVQADFAQNDSTAADYIKNRPCYAEVGETLFDGMAIFDEGSGQMGYTFECDIYGHYGVVMPEDQTDEAYISALNEMIGKTFIVTLNGETQGASFKTFEMYGMPIGCIGNVYVYVQFMIEMMQGLGGTEEEVLELIEAMITGYETLDTGESFFMVPQNDLCLLLTLDMLSEDTDLATTVDLVIQEGIVKKLDRMFLPDDIGSKPTSMGDVLPKVSADDEGKVLMVVDGAWAISPIAYGDEVAY